MARKQYTREHHKKAYELYREKRNMQQVARDIGCQVQTLYEWRNEEYQCKFGCSFHGWLKLMEEEKEAKTATLQLKKQGNYSLVDHELAMRHTLDKPAKEKRHEDVDVQLDFIREDFERCADLQYLYNKIFYHLTERPLDFPSLISKVSGEPVDVEELYKQGIKPQTFEGAARILVDLGKEIDRLSGRDEARDKKGSKKDRNVIDVDAEVNDAETIRALLKAAEKNPEILNKVDHEDEKEKDTE